MNDLRKPAVVIVETEAIYAGIYQAAPFVRAFDLVHITTGLDARALVRTVTACGADLVLLGTKSLDHEVAQAMGCLREGCPGVGVVLLVTAYSPTDSEVLRELTRKGKGGLAVCLRQNLQHLEHLMEIVATVSHRQVVFDPVLADVVFSGRPSRPFLNRLTPKEIGILDLVSNGHSNAAIARSLCVDIKTVEAHLNNIYSKLRADGDVSNKHLRVTAAMRFAKEAETLEGFRSSLPGGASYRRPARQADPRSPGPQPPRVASRRVPAQPRTPPPLPVPGCQPSEPEPACSR